ncbi:ACP S-malonyltransferase [Paenibacillus sp. QZ-Y1]|uniref:ACP S-malonyltransferase n=1 Tax=Paenibacillus sp. QZ-Y1 TaxID=3414511 RepID=UPI003F7A67BB
MKTAVLFPGQGSQYVGMCKELLASDPVTITLFEEAGDELGINLAHLVLEGPLDQLTQSEYAQPAVLTASYALFQSWERLVGVKPDYAAGHSLGEISALIAAQAVPFAEGVRFAARRGALMHRALKEDKGRAGIVVDMKQSDLEEIIAEIRKEHYLTISGYNTPRQFIVAGTAKALRLLDEATDRYEGEFIPFRMMPMKVDAPYHSELMAFVQPELNEMISQLTFHTPEFPICSTVSAEVVQSAEQIPLLLSRQLLQPVHWNQVLTQLKEHGVQTWMDIGPNETIRNMVAENVDLPAGYAWDNSLDRARCIHSWNVTSDIQGGVVG